MRALRVMRRVWRTEVSTRIASLGGFRSSRDIDRRVKRDGGITPGTSGARKEELAWTSGARKQELACIPPVKYKADLLSESSQT